MSELLGITPQGLYSQLLVGLINGSFYAILSLGLAVIFGAFVIVGLQNQLADKVGSWVQVIMGIIFVVCVLAFRRGIVGELMALVRKMGVSKA